MIDVPIRFYEGEISRIVLAAPPKNEMNATFFETLFKITDHLSEVDTKGIIISGEGRNFSSGAAVSELVARFSGADPDRSFLKKNIESFEKIASEKRPVVAAISGCCLGSGMELALACRYRIATRSAMFGLVETGFGLMPGCGGAVRLAAELGVGKAARLVLSGCTFGAEEALSLGIIHGIVDKKNLAESAELLVRQFAFCK